MIVMMVCSGRGERLRLFNSFFKFFSLIFFEKDWD